MNTGRDGVKIACYQWLPGPDEPKFVVYISHGYADYACAYYNVVERILSIGGAVYAHDHYAHGKSGPFEVSHKQRCQLNKSVSSKLGFSFNFDVSYEMAKQDLSLRIDVVKMSVKFCRLSIDECHIDRRQSIHPTLPLLVSTPLSSNQPPSKSTPTPPSLILSLAPKC